MPIYVDEKYEQEITNAIVVHMGTGDVGVVSCQGLDSEAVDEIHFLENDDGEKTIGMIELVPTGFRNKSKVVLAFDSVESVDVVLTQLLRIKHSILQFNFGDLNNG